nr:alpha-glucan phosphorylase [Conchiformibius kuhniae]
MGAAVWQKATKTDYPKSVVVFFSKRPPMITAPYLSKPIKFDTLFLSLRNLLQGNGVWVGNLANGQQGGAAAANGQQAQPVAPSKPAQPERAAEMRIPRFDPRRGLLGRFRELLKQNKDTVIVFNEKPVLAVFPAIQRVWVPDSKLLESLCRQEQPDIKVKIISEGSQIQERANATVVSCMWQVAVWTANGRLVYPLTPASVCRLKQWYESHPSCALARIDALVGIFDQNIGQPEHAVQDDAFGYGGYSELYCGNLPYRLFGGEPAGCAAADTAAAAAMPKATRRPAPAAAGAAHDDGDRTEEADAPKKVGGGLLSRLMKRLLSK